MLSTKLKEAAGNSADATLYVDDVFSTWLYTGTGANQTITNGIDLAGKGGMVWLKTRNAANPHYLTDTVRGVNSQINSNTTDAAETLTNRVTSFNSSGFSIGTSSLINSNGELEVSWTFRKAPKFFDVVTYTGNGTTQTIAHNLNCTVGMVIVKNTTTNGSWIVWSRGASSGNYLILNTNAAQDTINAARRFGNNTITVNPTSTSFTVGDLINTTSDVWVAYLFAHDTSSTGIIQCGSFTTDGSGNATVNLGWEPQYLLVKTISATNPWFVCDTMRGMNNSNGIALQPNLSSAEFDGGPYAVPTATGLKIQGLSVFGGTNIYMAIRMPNKPPTTGTQVYSPNLSSAATGTPITTGFPIDAQIFAGKDLVGHNTAIASRLTGVSTTATNSGVNLFTNLSAIEATNNFTRGWNNTGFQICGSFGGYNTIYWNFKRAPGFFDEVCYTGTGSAATQAHNLGVVPEMMIVKERSAVNDWWVYVSSVGNTKYSVLNSTAIPVASSTAWNNTTPTASVFSIGTGANVNASTQTYVAYLFATLAGISKVGSYTGNGTGQAIACGFSAGARFVLIKRTDAAGDWYTFDSARGLTSGSSPYLLLNSTAVEVTGNNGVYASTGGFTLGATAITTTNIATATYIFLAVA